MSVIVVENLVKTFRVAERRVGVAGALVGVARRRYRTVRALDGVSFSLEEGELLGYIGPNGAGKSTTVKILSGILVPEAGRVEVLGRTPWKHRIETVRQIGVVFGQRTQLWWDLPVIESFELLRDIYRVPQSEYERSRDELVDLLEIGPLLDTPVRQLSLGQRMRCDLAAALLHDVLENCGIPVSEIEAGFGPEIAKLVEGVTKLSKVSWQAPEAVSREAQAERPPPRRTRHDAVPPLLA